MLKAAVGKTLGREGRGEVFQVPLDLSEYDLVHFKGRKKTAESRPVLLLVQDSSEDISIQAISSFEDVITF